MAWHKKKPAHMWRSWDRNLFLAIGGLVGFGLLAVYNSSIVMAIRDFNDPYYFVKDQLQFALIGFTLMYIVSVIDYRNWFKLSIPFLGLTLILLVAVFIPGIGVKTQGAKRWLNLGFTSVQPTEIAKLALVLYLSAWFTYKERSRFVPFIVLLLVFLGLIILQPDMGTASIISIMALLMYFVSQAPLWDFLLLLPVTGAVGLLLAVIAPYRLARLLTFFNPDRDPLGTSYHIRQILIALGSGGFWGLGLGKSRQKYEYLPEANTDSIFAIIAEEVGFLGSVILIVIMGFVVWRIFQIAKKAPDRFGQLVAAGVAIWFGVQTLVNLSSMVALLPLTGVPLPLISYGGSSLVMLLIGLGVVLNISRQTKETVKPIRKK